MKQLVPVLIALITVSQAVADAPPVAGKAKEILATHCVSCHGTDGKAKGGFAYVLDRERLVTRQKIVPGKSAESELFERTRNGEMPPASVKRRPSEAEIAILKQWIEAGAADWQTSAPRSFVSEDSVLRSALEDVRSFPERQQRFLRYFTFTHLANAGLAEADLLAHRQALAKLVNSLSWHPRVTAPVPIDPGHTVFRIDLRDYRWNARSWDRLIAAYPYRPAEETAEAKALAAATGSELPVLRGDWFVDTASRPPLYHDLLGLPDRDKGLERLVGVELLTDVQEENAARAGFNGSGVSRNNRILERHDANYGAYWRTYDFADNTERRNVFDHPLGPAAAGNSFVPDGGEIIFHLPNGLHGYMLVDRAGRRIDRAPVEIVSDPKRSDRIVENGISCMSCHVKGVIPKADQVRAHVLKNRTSFTAADIASVKALYPTEARLKARFDEDSERFTKALAKLDVSSDDPEPVSTVALRYQATLDLATMAAEVGLTAKEFADRLQHSTSLARLLGPLKVKGGTVQRSVLVAAFPEIGQEVRRAGISAAVTKETPSPFTGHDGSVLCVTFASDSKTALTGGEDKTLRLWDVASGRQLRLFEGHRDAVIVVALSADRKLAASASRDRSLLLWDVESDRQRARLDYRTSKVRCLAFSPDGKSLLVGADDGSLQVWDVSTAKVSQRLMGHTGAVTDVAVSPDGKQALSVGHDHTARLWDLMTGKQVRQFEGHRKEIYAVAFSPDGRRAVTGGNDRVLCLWDVSTGKELRRFEGHANAVIRVAFSPDGKQVWSGSSQYQSADRVLRGWDAETGKELTSFGTGEGEEVWCLAFSADGGSALAGSSAKSLRLWKLK